ncbi:unnamed protein product [Malus baccata var. baccata]
MSTVRNNQLQGRVAIITGGASGIGEATARLFADHGATMVMIADIQDELGRQVAESIGTHRCSYVHYQTVLDLDFSAFDRLFDVNVRGMALCVKHAARVMVERSVRGSIVCTASVAANHGMEIRTDYCMSKHAVLGLVRSASRQLGVEAEDAAKMFESHFGLKAEGKMLSAESVADAALFLASDDSEFITGHSLVVDGGVKI